MIFFAGFQYLPFFGGDELLLLSVQHGPGLQQKAHSPGIATLHGTVKGRDAEAAGPINIYSALQQQANTLGMAPCDGVVQVCIAFLIKGVGIRSQHQEVAGKLSLSVLQSAFQGRL